uniref:efflux RND transporter permease subunit n=1 Tax=Prevotella heparinolytica TaxID=28113 RepID=UPI00359F5E25
MKIEKINDWFARRGKWMVQRRWLVLSLFILVFTIGFTGLRYFKVSASWEDYFLEDDPMLVKTEEFKEIFGNDNFAAVLTRCDNSFTKENLELIRELTNEMMDSLSYADKITSLTDIEFMVGSEEGIAIEQIVPDTIPSDPALLEGIRRKAYLKPHVAERLVSKDGTLSWIILKLRPFPEDSVWNKGKNAVSPEVLTGNELEHIITKDKYQKLHPKGTGLPYVTAMKLKWMEKEMPRVMGLAALVSVLILLFVTRSFRGVVVPIVTAIGSIVIVYGMLGYVGMTIDSGMVMIPMLLTFAVSIAYNMHVYSYFKRQFLIHGKRKQAVEETVREMGWPVLFSALTTFAALLSFLAIPMQPMRFIGIATSSCVMLAFFIAITLMPVFLSFGKDGKPHPQVQKTGGCLMDRKLEKLGKSVLKHGTLILCLAGLITVVFIYQFTKIETAFDVERTMGRKIAYVNNLLE